jgi:hypothetical protein
MGPIGGARIALVAPAGGVDRLQEVGGMIGFGQNPIDSEGRKRGEMSVQNRCAADENRLLWILRADAAADLHARADRKLQVEQDDVEGAQPAVLRDTLATIGRLHHFVALEAQKLGDQAPEHGLIFDQQQTPLASGAHGLLLESRRGVAGVGTIAAET